MPAICHNRRTTTFYNFSTTFEAKRMAQEDTRRMKKISRIEYCAGFEPLQSGMEQDEGSRILLPTMKSLDSDKKSSKTSEAAPAASEPTTSVSAESVQLDLSKVKIEPLFEEFVDFDTFAKSDFRVVKIEACEAVPKSKKLLKFTLNDGTDKKRTILSGIHEYYEPEQLVGKTCVAITNLPTRMMMGIPSEGMLISAVYEYDGHEGLNLLMLDDAIPAGAKLY
jgi:methionine--tRNA ligase beta chain